MGSILHGGCAGQSGAQPPPPPRQAAGGGEERGGGMEKEEGHGGEGRSLEAGDGCGGHVVPRGDLAFRAYLLVAACQL